MNTKAGFRGLFIVGCLLAGLGVCIAAEEVRQIMWKDLLPVPAADQVFPKLSKQQALQLADIADVRERQARGEKIGSIELEDERAAVRKLEQAGFDVEALLSKRRQFVESSRVRASAVNGTLDGQTVRMPGYILPLEFSGKEVSEFLLVPYVGACIHTPPPPPNQIVHVKADKPVANVTVFSAVWVTGRLAAVSAKKSLSLVDGSADIDIGYSMRAATVELYKE